MFHLNNSSFNIPVVAPGTMSSSRSSSIAGNNTVAEEGLPTRFVATEENDSSIRCLEGRPSFSRGANGNEDAAAIRDTLKISFRGLAADVPDDLLSITPTHGWETPPDSPPCESRAFVDGPSMMAAKGAQLLGFEIPAHLQGPGAVFEWTPPASPDSCSVQDEGEDEGEGQHHDDLASFLGDSFDQFSDFETSSADVLVLAPASPHPAAQKVCKRVKKRKAGKPQKAGKPKAEGTKRKGASVLLKRRRLGSHAEAEAEHLDRATAYQPAGAALLPSTHDEGQPESRRHMHNVMERQRRTELKSSYQRLREQLPALKGKCRATTNQILLHTVECVASLAGEERELALQLAAAKSEGARLRALRTQ